MSDTTIRRIGNTFVAMGAICVLTAILMSGCSASTDRGEHGGAGVECAGLGDGYESCTVTLPDTRRVQCVYRKLGYSGGLDCDWTHADGSDAL